MEVLCIHDGPWTLEDGPKYMEKCTVLKIKKYKNQNGYILQEYNVRIIYNSKFFIPISDIDETELVNEKIEHPCAAI